MGLLQLDANRLMPSECLPPDTRALICVSLIRNDVKATYNSTQDGNEESEPLAKS
jgi:hypothetical protein